MAGARVCRRFVTVSHRVRVGQKGRGVRLFAYGYADLADMFAMTEPAVRMAVRRGTLHPGDLRSVFEFMLSRLGDRRVRERLLGPMPEPLEEEDAPTPPEEPER